MSSAAKNKSIIKTCFKRKNYLPFIAKPVVVFESVQKKSRAFGLPQQSVKAVVNISASPLTRFEIMPKQDLQSLNFAYKRLLNKLYENEVTLTGQNSPSKCC